MRKREEMHLVKDGNAFYEVDEVCMRSGLNKRENEDSGKHPESKDNYSHRNTVK